MPAFGDKGARYSDDYYDSLNRAQHRSEGYYKKASEFRINSEARKKYNQKAMKAWLDGCKEAERKERSMD